MISIEVKAKEVLFAWNCMAQVMQMREVEPQEEEQMFETMEALAGQHRKSKKQYKLKLEVDQYKAVWHSINLCREKGIIPEKKDSLGWAFFAKVAESLDVSKAIDTSPLILLDK